MRGPYRSYLTTYTTAGSSWTPIYQCQHQWVELCRYKTAAGSSTDPADYSWDKIPAMVREQCALCWAQRERME